MGPEVAMTVVVHSYQHLVMVDCRGGDEITLVGDVAQVEVGFGVTRTWTSHDLAQE